MVVAAKVVAIQGMKNMPAIVNVGDFVKVAIIAFVFIKLVNVALAKLGASQYGI